MRILIPIVMVGFSWLVVAQDAPVFVTSDGETSVVLEDKGFTIKPPSGWLYSKEVPRVSLMAKAAEEGEYLRTIQVMSFDGARELNDATIEEFQSWLVTTFGKQDARIADYAVRNYLPVDLESGLKAYLFYTEFKLTGADLMQMHVVVSSEDRTFVTTFTDLAKFFDVEDSPSEHLNEAWAAVNTIQLQAPLVPATTQAAWFGGLAILCLMGGGALWWYRRSQLVKQFANLEATVEGQSDPISHQPVSLTPVRSIHLEAVEEDDIIEDNKDIDFDKDQLPKAG